jgi:hypothetical protein
MKKLDERDDLWPFSLHFTVALAMPMLFWLGWLARGYAR